MPVPPITETTLTLAQRRRFAERATEIGFPAACGEIGMLRETGARLLAGLGVRRATLIVAGAAIDALPPSTVVRPRPVDPLAVQERPQWLDAWAEKYLTAEQRRAFEGALAKNLPAWSKP